MKFLDTDFSIWRIEKLNSREPDLKSLRYARASGSKQIKEQFSIKSFPLDSFDLISFALTKETKICSRVL